MAYRLSPDEPVPDGVRRLATERLDHAIEALRTGDDPTVAVHDARKDIKKTRSLLRLVREGLGDDVVRGEQEALRAAAGLLAASRDAAVLGQTLDDLADRYAGRLPHAAFTQARDAVIGGAGETRTTNDEQDATARDAAAGALAAVRDRVAHWPADRCDWDVVVDGLTRSYRRGRGALDHAGEGDADQLHDWRKRVKDLWYQERLLRDAWPVVMKAQASEAHVLTELLGDHHDLSVLRDALVVAQPPPLERDGLLELIDARSGALLAKAIRLGRRVYAEKPKAFRRRIARYVRTSTDHDDGPGPVADPGGGP